jgi:hypothetical protein
MIDIITFPNEPIITFVYKDFNIMYYYKNKNKLILIGTKLDYMRKFANFSLFSEETYAFYEFDNNLNGTYKLLIWNDIVKNVHKILTFHKIPFDNLEIITT